MLGIVPFGPDEEFLRRLSDTHEAAPDPTWGTANLLMQMATMPPPAQQPVKPRVSGSDVIGLSPEQTTQLLNRVQQQAQWDASLANEQNARRDRAIEGLNERVFRARDAEADRRARAEAQRQQQQFWAQRDAAREQAERERWEREQAQGDILTLPDGSQVRRYLDPQTGQMATEPFANAAPRYFQQGGQFGYVDANGTWVPVQGAPQTPSAGGASGTGAGAGTVAITPQQVPQLVYSGVLSEEEGRAILEHSGIVPPSQHQGGFWNWVKDAVGSLADRPELAAASTAMQYPALRRGLEQLGRNQQQQTAGDPIRDRLVTDKIREGVAAGLTEDEILKEIETTIAVYDRIRGGAAPPQALSAPGGLPPEALDEVQSVGGTVNANGTVSLPNGTMARWTGSDWEAL